MFKTTVTEQPKPKRICHGWWQPSSREKGWLITRLTHMFRQRSRTKWDQFRSAVESLRDSFLSKTLISAPQISRLSSTGDGHLSTGRERRPRQINNISITHTHTHTDLWEADSLGSRSTRVEVMSPLEQKDLMLFSPLYQGDSNNALVKGCGAGGFLETS